MTIIYRGLMQIYDSLWPKSVPDPKWAFFDAHLADSACQLVTSSWAVLIPYGIARGFKTDIGWVMVALSSCMGGWNL